MDFQKLDAGLLSAYEDAVDDEHGLAPFEVFVHTMAPPTPEQAALLRRFGVRNIVSGRKLFTGSVTAEGVALLSDQSWVKTLTSAQQLFPAERRRTSR